MAKKKKLTDLQYYKWKLACERLMHSKTRQKLTGTEFRLRDAHANLATMQVNIFKANVQQANDELELSKSQYDTIREEIEKELGFSISGKIINDVTFEITDDEDIN